MVLPMNVITFNEKYLKDFVRLNREWIETFFRLEPMDVVQLENPYDAILAVGGEIFFVLDERQAIGTCAMIPHGPGCYELAKMAVAPAQRGRGLGDTLMTTAISWAREKGADRIMLLSNTVLEPAISLYTKHGFEVTHLGKHPDYDRCNIEMLLRISIDEPKG